MLLCEDQDATGLTCAIHREQASFLSLSCQASPWHKSSLPMQPGVDKKYTLLHPSCRTHSQTIPSLYANSVRSFNAEMSSKESNLGVKMHLQGSKCQVLMLKLWLPIQRPWATHPPGSTEALPRPEHPKHLVTGSARTKQKINFPPPLRFPDVFESPEKGNGPKAPKIFGMSCGSRDACANVTLLLLALGIRLQLKLG